MGTCRSTRRPAGPGSGLSSSIDSSSALFPRFGLSAAEAASEVELQVEVEGIEVVLDFVDEAARQLREGGVVVGQRR